MIIIQFCYFSGSDGSIQVWKDDGVNTVSELIKNNPELTPTITENIVGIKAEAIMWFIDNFEY